MGGNNHPRAPSPALCIKVSPQPSAITTTWGQSRRYKKGAIPIAAKTIVQPWVPWFNHMAVSCYTKFLAKTIVQPCVIKKRKTRDMTTKTPSPWNGDRDMPWEYHKNKWIWTKKHVTGMVKGKIHNVYRGLKARISWKFSCRPIHWLILWLYPLKLYPIRFR